MAICMRVPTCSLTLSLAPVQPVLDRPAGALGEHEAAVVHVTLLVVLRERLQWSRRRAQTRHQQNNSPHCRLYNGQLRYDVTIK